MLASLLLARLKRLTFELTGLPAACTTLNKASQRRLPLVFRLSEVLGRSAPTPACLTHAAGGG